MEGWTQVSYAVLDFETTGLVPERSDRAVEIGVVLLSDDGVVEREWSTLLNPQRDIGPSQIHGIRAAELLDAPEFRDVADDVLELVAGRVTVAHNAPFDMRFLWAELARAGYSIAQRPPALCTMKWARNLIGAERLQDCCDVVGIRLVDAHSALADARATAELVARLSGKGATFEGWRRDAEISRSFRWPVSNGRSGFATPVVRGSADLRKRSWLEHVLESAWIPSGSEDEASYLLTLEYALLDRTVSLTEGMQLVQSARASGLSRDTVRRLHHEYLAAVSREALVDDRLTDEELADLHRVAGALGLTAEDVQGALEVAAKADKETSRGAEAFALKRGDRVVFTGETMRPRETWIAEIVRTGLTSGGVTKSTKVVVSADPDSLSGKARKARQYGVPVVDEVGFANLFEAYQNQS